MTSVPDAGAVAARWMGARVMRVEDPRFLTGTARFVSDIKLPRCVHVAFVRSPYGHATVTAIDTSQARALEGVHEVWTGEDTREVLPLLDNCPLEGLVKTPQNVLTRDRVRFCGEAVAVTVADSRYIAEDAADLIEVSFDPLATVGDVEASMEPGAPLLFPDAGTNVVYQRETATGNAAQAFANAEHVFEGKFHTNRFMAAPMETRGCLAEYDASAGRLTFWSSTQTPHTVRLTLSVFLGIPENRIRVIAPDVGGGFGQKITIYPEEVIVALLARHLRRPVKWIEDRRENLLAATHAKQQMIDVEVAVDGSGELRGMRAKFVGDGGGYSFNTATALIEPQLAATLMPGVYKISDYDYEVSAALTNKAPTSSYRAVGWTAGHVARELLFDEIARALKIDPVEFRTTNMVDTSQLPFTTCTGMEYDSGSFKESIAKACDVIEYDEFRKRQHQLRRVGRCLGIGVSPFVEQTGWGTQAALQSGVPIPSHDTATVSIQPTGTVTVKVGLHSHGQGLETTLAQVAADNLGVSPESVNVIFGDTDAVPFGMGTYASRSAIIGNAMVGEAGRDVRRQILTVASDLMEAGIDDLELQEGYVSVKGTPQTKLALGEIAMAAYFEPSVRRGEHSPALTATKFYDPRATYSNGCIAVTLEVDTETGLVQIDRIVAVEDCGVMINPAIVEGQVHGAVAQGIGGALLEQLVYDDDVGQLLTSTYMDYLIPTAEDVPPIEVVHLETPSPVTMDGVKGMAEGGLLATPGAIACAVADALSGFGVVVRNLPLGPDEIRHLLRTAPR